MRDSYFFDKRKMKRGFLKYGIILLISFVPVVLFNVLVSKYIEKNWLVIFLDCVLILVFVVIGNGIVNRIYAKKDAKLEARIRERDALDEKKREILENSYKQKREQKKSQTIIKASHEDDEDKENLSKKDEKIETKVDIKDADKPIKSNTSVKNTSSNNTKKSTKSSVKVNTKPKSKNIETKDNANKK